MQMKLNLFLRVAITLTIIPLIPNMAHGVDTASTTKQPLVIIFSQPDPKLPKNTYVDMAVVMDQALKKSGEFRSLPYSQKLSEVRNAVQQGRLSALDITPPLTLDTMQKIAHALGADLLLSISAHYVDKGIKSTVLLERSVGLQDWSSVFLLHLTPAKTDTKANLLDLMNGLRDIILQHMALQPASAASTVPPPSQPVTVNPSAQPNSFPSAPAGSTGTTTPEASSSMQAYQMLIQQARKTGDIANLIVSLRRAINLKPTDPTLRRELIKAYEEKGWTEKAKKEAERAVALSPKSAALHQLLGDTFADESNNDLALKEYQTAVALDPKDANLLISLADMEMKMGDNAQALKDYQQAAASDPSNPLPHSKLAIFYFQTGDYGSAGKELLAAKALLPPNDNTTLQSDVAAILQKSDSILTDIILRIQQAHKDFMDGFSTREAAFQKITAIKQNTMDLNGFLQNLPNSSLQDAVSQYSLAASLLSQSTEEMLDYLQSNRKEASDQSELLRLEAANQITTAENALKADLSKLEPAASPAAASS